MKGINKLLNLAYNLAGNGNFQDAYNCINEARYYQQMYQKDINSKIDKLEKKIKRWEEEW